MEFADESGGFPSIEQDFSPYAQTMGDPKIRLRNERTGEFIRYAIPSAAAGFADTFLTSVGILDEKELEQALTATFQQFGDYYSRHKEAAQTVGDLTGMFIPGMAATKIFRAGSFLQKAAQKGGKASKLLTSIFASGQSYDRLLRGIRARDIYLAKKGVANFLSDDKRRQFVNKALTTRLADTIKETVAFELGVFATMHNSDVLYPDEMSTAELFALNAVFPAAFAVGERMYLKRLIRGSAQSRPVTDELKKAINPRDFPLDEVLSQKGMRDLQVTTLAVTRSALRQSIDETGQSIKATALNAHQLELKRQLEKSVMAMAKDSPIETITKSVNIDQNSGLVQTAMNALDKDETIFLGTHSYEPAPAIADMPYNLDPLRKKRIQQLENKITNIKKHWKFDANGNVIDYKPGDFEKIDQINREINTVNAAQSFILEPDGVLVPSAFRKPIYQDGPQQIRFTSGGQLSGRIAEVEISDPLYLTKKHLIGFDENLNMIVPPRPDETTLSNINVKQIIDPVLDAQHPDYFRLLLKDMGEDWHFKSGHRGKEVFKNLPDEIQREIDKWTGSSGASQIREWVKDNNPKARIIYEAYSGMRQRLSELAAPDGTIPLFRGESRRAFENPRFDVVSMSANAEKAKDFGEIVTVQHIPVEDVIMIVGGLGQEWEYIVKNNFKRTIGRAGKASTDKFEPLTLYQRSAGYAAGQKMLNKIVDNVESGKRGLREELFIGPGEHHTRIDAVLELYDRLGDRITNKIKFMRGIDNFENLEFASLQSKLVEYVRMQKVIDQASAPGALGIADKQRLNYYDVMKMLNIPEHVLRTFNNIYQQGDVLLQDAVKDLEHFKRLMQEEAFFPEVTQFLNKELPLRGDMYRRPMNKSGTSLLPPGLVIKRPVDNSLYSRDGLVEATKIQRALFLKNLQGARAAGANLVAKIIEDIGSRPEHYQTARAVDTLIEGQQRGTGAVSTQQRARGEMPVMQSAQFMEELVDKAVRLETAEYFKKYDEVFAQLRAHNNKHDLDEFATYVHARRQGWDVKDAPVLVSEEGGIKKWGLELTNTKDNRRRFELLYGRQMDKEGELMPSPTRPGDNNIPYGQRIYRPLAISQRAMDGAVAFRELGQNTLRNTNFIKKLYGGGATKFKSWWVPPKNLSRTNTAFIVDPVSDKVVSIVSGSNPQAAWDKALKEIELRKEKLMIVTPEDMTKYFSLHDTAFEKFADFTDPLNQTGKAKGTSVGEQIETGIDLMNDMVGTIQRQFESISRRTRVAMFESEINYVRRMYNATKPVSGKKGQSIFQQYMAALFGNPTLNPNDIIGRHYFAIESSYDELLEKLWQKKTEFLGQTEVPKIATAAEKKRFAALDKQMADWNPFNDALDYAQRTTEYRTPVMMKKHMAKLTSLTSLLTLRLMELGHPILNLTSLAATVPAVTKGLKRFPHETAEQHAARIGAFGLQVDADNAMYHPIRAITSTMHNIFSEEYRWKIWSAKNPDSAVNKGFLDQQVAEIFRTLTAPQEGYVEGLIRKYTDILSTLSDKSERIARGIAFAHFYNIAKRGHLTEDDNIAFAFAHRNANETIGNYAPNNRPRMFQGAVGMPLGLFTTFMWNYFERIFGYIENKATRALVTQYATQAAVFGGQTVPGFTQFNDFFASNYDGTVNIVDGLDRIFGPEITEWFLYGVLSNLPKLFGADTGIALYTRGDVNFRNIPTIFTLKDTPVVAMIGDTLTALKKGVQMVRERGGFSGQQMAEILAAYSTSRFLRNVGYITSGYVLDRNGQVVGYRDNWKDILTGEVSDELGLIASAVGMRKMDEAKKVEAHYRIHSGEMSRLERRRWLRDRIRADVRGGITEQDVKDSIASYVKIGGDPAEFPRFYMEQVLKGQVDKSQLEFIRLFNNERRSYDVQRLLSVIGPGFGGDPEYE